MTNNGLYKLWGGAYTRQKPHLCKFCQHFEGAPAEGQDREWMRKTSGWAADGICHAKGKLLSAPNKIPKRNRCDDYTEVADREWREWMDAEQHDPDRYWWQYLHFIAGIAA